MAQGPRNTRASSMSGFSALLFHVFIVWGLKIETLVKNETLDKLISPWPSFLTIMRNVHIILVCRMVVRTNTPHALPGTEEALGNGVNTFFFI